MAVFQHASEVSEALGIPFSDEQLAAITAPLEPGVIIAGAGTGKTTVMAARVVWLVGSGHVRPEGVLGLTFTRKAAAELSARVHEALERAGVVEPIGTDDEGEQVISTYDAFAARLVADHGLRLGVDTGARMLTGAARYRLASRVVAEARGPWDHLSRLTPDGVTEKVLALDSQLAAHLVSPEALREHAAAFARDIEQAPRTRAGKTYQALESARDKAAERAELADLVGAYRRAKRERGWVEFADQMAVAAELARDVPAVSAALREQFPVVLLDEYQDTSAAQAAMLTALFSGREVHDGLGHPVTAVGDPRQAIYGWRGAAAANMDAFAREFPRADGTPATAYTLTVNRRSGQRILDAANTVAGWLQPADREGTATSLDALVAPETAPEATVMVATLDTWPDEVAFVADDIVAAHEGGRVARWSDMAVLARINDHIRSLYAALTERGVPVQIVGLDGLLAVPEVADIVAVLRVLGNPTANADLVRILTGPRWALGPADLAALGRRARMLAGERDTTALPPNEEIARLIQESDPIRSPSLAEALADPGTGPWSAMTRERLQACAAELEGLRAHVGEPVTDLIRRVIATIGLEVELALRGPEGTRQMDAFVQHVTEYAGEEEDGSLAGLLAWLAAEERHGAGLDQAVPRPADAVTLLTMHRAKGLEWEHVYLPGLADGVFPSGQGQGNWVTSSAVLPADLRGDADHIPQLSEVSKDALDRYATALAADARAGEHRLAYVAFTRARSHLTATTHAWGRPVRQREASPYLRVLTEVTDQVMHADVSPSNPLTVPGEGIPWPAWVDPQVQARRREVSAWVRAAQGSPMPSDQPELGFDDAALVAAWDAASARLLAEARLRRETPGDVLPPHLSATALIALRSDAPTYRAALDRPMPRPPRGAARVGEAFHAWLERRFTTAPTLLEDPDDDGTAAAELADLTAAFEAGPFADRIPAATEVPFSLFLAGQVIRGRIDAVFTDRDRPQVVDWKTGRGRPDSLQLSLYRLAWAELHGLAVEDVDAAFYDVARGVTVAPEGLIDRPGLEQLVQDLVSGD